MVTADSQRYDSAKARGRLPFGAAKPGSARYDS